MIIWMGLTFDKILCFELRSCLAQSPFRNHEFLGDFICCDTWIVLRKNKIAFAVKLGLRDFIQQIRFKSPCNMSGLLAFIFLYYALPIGTFLE